MTEMQVLCSGGSGGGSRPAPPAVQAELRALVAAPTETLGAQRKVFPPSRLALHVGKQWDLKCGPLSVTSGSRCIRPWLPHQAV